MYEESGISADAQAIILVCTSLGLPRGDATRPFGPRGWAKLSARIGEPSGLIALSSTELLHLLGADAGEADRLQRLLARTGQLAFELDRLRSRGIWTLTLADDRYPARLRERLAGDAPPVLFGSGEESLLDAGGVAIIGSRDVDEAGIAFTRRLAAAVARGASSVVSGGARGVDQEAMRAAFDAGGTVVGALPEGIESRIRDGTTRAALADGLAVLVSPYHPAAGFSAGAAMARNKVVYALSDAAVVVSSAAESGGTWTGAVEALRAAWVPVLVRNEDGVPAGNAALISAGARPLDPASIGDATTANHLVAASGESAHRAAEDDAAYDPEQLTLID